MKKLSSAWLLGGSLSKKLGVFVLLAMTVLSMAAIVDFVPPVMAGPGTHRVTATFYRADVINDANLFGPADFYFSLAWPTGVTEEVGPYSADNGDTVDFPDRTCSWLFTDKIEYWCVHRQEDIWGETFEGGEGQMWVPIYDPWSLALNTWHDDSDEWGGDMYWYSKFYIENKRPEVSAISGPSSGYTGVAYTWTTTGSDPEGDSLGQYYWYVDEELIDHVPSNSFTYAFPANASYEDHIIMVRVKDYFGRFSNYKYKVFTVDPNPADQSILTVNTVGSGSVSLNPPGGVYDDRTVVELTANSDSGWRFGGWSGDLSGFSNPESITMNEDKTVTATFTEIPGAILPPPLTRVSDWPMFQYDLARSGKTPSEAPNTNSILWTYPTDASFFSSPAVVNGKIYFGSYGKVYCLDAFAGTSLWNYTTALGFGGVNSPVIVSDRVYAGAYSDYSVYCLDAVTGDYVWSYATGGNVNSCPLVVDGQVYVGSWDDWFYCLDASNGLVDWKYKTGYDIKSSSAAIADGRVYVGSMDKNLYCFDAATGTLIWNYTAGTFPVGYVYSSPAIVDGRVYFGSADRNVYCLDAATGAFVWSYTTGDEILSSPAVSDGLVYIGSGERDRKLYCLDASTGTEIWSFVTGGAVHSSPAIADKKVYFGSEDSNIYCLNAMTGTLVWKYTTGGGVESSPAIADGIVYIGSSDGTLYAFGGGTSGIPEIPDVTPTDTRIPKISVEPLTVDFGVKCVDYPPRFDEVIIENVGDKALIVHSITLIEDGGGAFVIEEIFLEGRLGALFPAETPLVLDPGKLLYVLVEFDDVDEQPHPFSGVLEINSNDPDNPIVEVSLSGSGQTASGASTVDVGDVYPSVYTGEEGRWVVPIEVDDDGVITEAYAADFFNLVDYDLELYEDAKGVTVTGTLDCLSLPGRMLLEVWSESSPEKLTVYNILISPVEAEGDQDTPSLPTEIVIVALVAVVAVIVIFVYLRLRKRK